MNLNVTIDGIAPVTKALQGMAGITPAQVAAGMADTVNDAFVAHFTKLQATRPNKLGGKRTNYWAECARSTKTTPTGSEVQVVVSQEGIRRHYKGGPPIKPSGRTSEVTGNPIRALTIPIHPAAHGVTVAGLQKSLGVKMYRDGRVLKAQVGQERQESDPAYFALTKQVKASDGDPTVIPSNDTIFKAAENAVAELIAASTDG